MNKQTTSSKGGISFMGALAIALIVLKLLGRITWSWLWVLSPIWGSMSILGIVALVLVAVVSKK